MTQGAVRDTPFGRKYPTTGLRRYQLFRKFNRAKLDKNAGRPLGPGDGAVDTVTTSPGAARPPGRREDQPRARAPDQYDSAASRMSARDDGGSRDVPASI